MLCPENRDGVIDDRLEGGEAVFDTSRRPWQIDN